ncbi:putative cytochrome P450, chaperone DnaJ, HSP40/DnaJ peptide-binding, cytochrome P450 superfamily [Helianthus annuus]|nr:putative cytochrome P450, chaperone DnaJ, HSP40/DnaJ peptide-binding, cytochrome P450 superfamily [Helianthus annuus]
MVCMKWVAMFLVIPLSKIAELVDLDFSVPCGLARWRLRWWSSELNMGVSGAMIALSMTSWFLMIGEFIYIFGGWCQDSWKGFTVAAFKDLVPVIKLSISSGNLEPWTYGTMLFWSYLLDICQTLSLDINSWEFMISLGFYGARCVWVANELGRGNAKAVKFYHRAEGDFITVDIEKGMQVAEEVVLYEEGEPVIDGEPGDLRFCICTAPHDRFRREGTNTTTTTLTWALALLVNHPVVLKISQQELENHDGRDRKVEESDMNNLVYLQAIIKETMCLYRAAPLSVPHKST